MRNNQVKVRLDDKELEWLEAINVRFSTEKSGTLMSTETASMADRMRQILYYALSQATPSYFGTTADITLSTLK